jgi:hypothetical protein
MNFTLFEKKRANRITRKLQIAENYLFSWPPQGLRLQPEEMLIGCEGAIKQPRKA